MVGINDFRYLFSSLMNNVAVKLSLASKYKIYTLLQKINLSMIEDLKTFINMS